MDLLNRFATGNTLKNREGGVKDKSIVQGSDRIGRGIFGEKKNYCSKECERKGGGAG